MKTAAGILAIVGALALQVAARAGGRALPPIHRTRIISYGAAR